MEDEDIVCLCTSCMAKCRFSRCLCFDGPQCGEYVKECSKYEEIKDG